MLALMFDTHKDALKAVTDTTPGAAASQFRRGCAGCLGRSLGGAALVVVLAVGANFVYRNYAHPDRLAGKGTPVQAPGPTRPVPPPARPPSRLTARHPVGQIMYELEQRVRAMTGVPEPVGGGCATKGFTGEQAASFDCTVTYRGHEVVYAVNAKPSGSLLFSYTARPKRGLLVGEGVLAEVWRTYHHQTTSLRCDQLPAIAEVPVNAPLPWRCYARFPRGKGFDRTALVTITVHSSDIADSILLRTESQR